MAGKSHNREISRLRADTGQHNRIMLVMAVLGILAFFPIGLRLYHLMVTQYDYYAAQALRNQTRTTTVSAERGTIYDRNMNILASSVGVENVYLNPHELKQAKEDVDLISNYLGQILEKDPDWIKAQALDYTKRYKQVGSRVEEETAAKIRSFINEYDISGIHLEPNSRRTYPYGTLASQVIGFTNASGEGSEGVEAAYDRYLSGSMGRVIPPKATMRWICRFLMKNMYRAGKATAWC